MQIIIFKENIHTMKTKLGLSVELTSALFLLFLLGTVFAGSSLFMYAAIVLGAYVLIKEEDLFLKGTVIKGILLVAFVTFINLCLGYADNLIEFINFFMGIAKADYIRDGFGIVKWIQLIIGIAEKIILMLLAVFAFKKKTVPLPGIDKIINKHLQ